MKLQHLSLSILFTFLLSSLSFGQDCPPLGPTFLNQQQIDDFATDYPNCKEIMGFVSIIEELPGAILNLKGLSQLEKVGGLLIGGNSNELRNTALRSLEGLENLTFVGAGVYIWYNDVLEDISALSNLDSIGFDLNLRQLPALTSLKGLENIEFIGENLEIDFVPQLTSLEEFGKLRHIGGNLSISENESLLSLEGLCHLETLGGVLDIRNNSQLVTLRGLEGLSFAISISIVSNDNLISLSGLENLHVIGDALLDWDGIQITNNNQLQNLSALRNVNLLPIDFLQILQNPQLSACSEPAICEYVIENLNTPFIEISLNTGDCETGTDIVANCNFAKVNYKIFYDSNQNGIRENEPIFSYAGILIEPDNVLHLPSWQNDDGGLIYLTDGTYQLSYNQATTPTWELTTDSASFQLNVDSNFICDTFLFGVFPNPQISAFTSHISTSIVRCNELTPFSFHATNLGGFYSSGTLWTTVDQRIDSSQFVNPPDTFVAPNRYGWHFTDLPPGQTFTNDVIFQIPGPPAFPVGDVLNFSTYVDFSSLNGQFQSHTFDYEILVGCSYDPNDKLVNPARENDSIFFGEDLIYTIRFQNTGNDFAYDVVIRDTLDQNLDASTFKLLSTSHPEVLATSLEADQYLTFSFENIFLPDSTFDFDGSQGYVTYFISPKDGLSEQTRIQNTASIYFDKNPPIVTNTTQSVLLSPSTSLREIAGIKFHIFPNPTTDQVYIQAPVSVGGQLQMTDLTGKILLQQPFEGNVELDLSQQQTGIYLISIQTGEGQITEKIIKL